MNATRLPRRRWENADPPAVSKGPAFRTSPVQAFTILELLLALGVIGLIATLLIGGSARVLAEKPASVDDVFWNATREARKIALETGREVHLAYADDREYGKHFVVDDGVAPQRFPIVAAVDLSVTLLPPPKTGIAGIQVGLFAETQTLPFAKFYADGTCTAFRVQVRAGRNTRILDIDPWTCAPVLPADSGR